MMASDLDPIPVEAEVVSLPAHVPRPTLPVPALATADLYAAVLSGRNARTMEAYRGDYEDFARYLGSPGPAAALETLVSLPLGLANAAALGYRAHMMDRKLAAATIRRRLAALRSACKLARQLGRCAWELEIEAPKVVPYRDTAGPGAGGWRAMRELAEARADTTRGRRDLAIVLLLRDRALRRAEVLGLDLADVDLARGVVFVVGKGTTERVPLSVTDRARQALADWIAARGDWPGPLFYRLDNAKSDGPPARLTGRAVAKMVGALGRRAGLSRPVRPHGLRHQAITAALEATGGNVARVQKFSRHAKPETVMVYNDAREDAAGEVSRLIGAD